MEGFENVCNFYAYPQESYHCIIAGKQSLYNNIGCITISIVLLIYKYHDYVHVYIVGKLTK